MEKKDIFLILFPLINTFPILVMNVCVTFSLIARLMFNVLTSLCIILDNLPLSPPIMSFFIPVQWMIVSPSPLLLIWSPPAPRPGHRGILWEIESIKLKLRGSFIFAVWRILFVLDSRLIPLPVFATLLSYFHILQDIPPACLRYFCLRSRSACLIASCLKIITIKQIN